MEIGVINRRDPVINPQDMADGLDALWRLLDKFNSDDLMIPYITALEFTVNSQQRRYTYGPGGDFNAPRPLNIYVASWRDQAGSEWPMRMVETRPFVEGNPYKETIIGRPWQMYYEPSFPVAQVEFEFFPFDTDTLLLKVIEPFSAEICPCCDTSDCFDGCEDPACEDGNVDPADYGITVAGCPIDDQACVQSGITQMQDYLETQCTTDCSETFTQDFLYDPGTGDITITATATPIPRTAMKPTQLCLTQKTEFPPGYHNLIVWNLAKFLASQYNMEPSQNVVDEATQAYNLIRARNTRSNQMLVDGALSWPGRDYNIFSGPPSVAGR